MLTRRQALKALATLGFASSASGGYALAEPFRTNVTSYAITPEQWPADLSLRIAIIADIHAIDPWVSVGRIERLVAQTNALQADAVLLLGDFVVGHRL